MITVTTCIEAHYRGPFKNCNQSLSCFYKPNQMKLKVYKSIVQGQIYFWMADWGHFWTTNINTVYCFRYVCPQRLGSMLSSLCKVPDITTHEEPSLLHTLPETLDVFPPPHLSADLLLSCQIPSSRFSELPLLLNESLCDSPNSSH